MSFPDLTKVEMTTVENHNYSKYDFEYKGVKCTYYWWPQGVFVNFIEDKNTSFEFPIFGLRNDSIERLCKSNIDACVELGNDMAKAHLHIFEIVGVPKIIALGCTFKNEQLVSTNFEWQDAATLRRWQRKIFGYKVPIENIKAELRRQFIPFEHIPGLKVKSPRM